MKIKHIPLPIMICSALVACSSTPAPAPLPTFSELQVDRQRIFDLAATTARQSDLPPGGQSTYRGAYVGEFATSQTSQTTRLAAVAEIKASFGASPTVTVSLSNVTSPDSANIGGSMTSSPIRIANGSFQDAATMTLTDVPLDGGAIAATLNADVRIAGGFTTNANQTTGEIGTGVTNGFTMNGRFAAERQP